MCKIKSVIFDMDGTLIDAKEWHYEALNKSLKLFGYEISRYEHLVTYDGLPTSDKLKMISMEKGLPWELHKYLNQLKQIYTVEMIYIHCRPIFIHEFALSRLKAAGYKLAVASNSIYDTVNLMMEKSNLKQYLEFYLSNQDVKKAKPDPEIYLLAIQKLGLKPEECLILEDNENGVQAAIRSGAHVMQISSVQDVTFDNICLNIDLAEQKNCGINILSEET